MAGFERFARVIVRRLRSTTRRYAEGADLSKLVRIPRCIDAFLSYDRVAYPLHVIVGDLLNWLHAPPPLVGLEWLKAAAHADSDRALQRVAQGLAVTRRRASISDFDLRIHAALVRRVTRDGQDVTMQRRQLASLVRAGIPIPAPESLIGMQDHVSESRIRP